MKTIALMSRSEKFHDIGNYLSRAINMASLIQNADLRSFVYGVFPRESLLGSEFKVDSDFAVLKSLVIRLLTNKIAHT